MVISAQNVRKGRDVDKGDGYQYNGTGIGQWDRNQADWPAAPDQCRREKFFVEHQDMENVILRSLRDNEKELLKEFLYEAIFIPEGMDPPDRSVTEQPELALYYEDFGSGPADHCIVAEADGRVVGAVWTRIMDDYGHVDEETPSFAISLYREYRGRGLGTAMMRRMLEVLKAAGYKRASLAVQKANYAVRMYEAAGFRTVRENDEEYIMVCEL